MECGCAGASSAPAFGSQTSESIGPKKLETPRKSRARKRESLGPWCHLKGELASEKEISHCSEDFCHSARETGTNTAKMGGTTSRPGLLTFLFNPKPHVAILKMALEGYPISISVWWQTITLFPLVSLHRPFVWLSPGSVPDNCFNTLVPLVPLPHSCSL